MKRFVAFVIAVCMLLTLSGCSSSEYQDGNALLGRGEYDSAYQIFVSLGDYKDCSEKAKLCKEALLNDFGLMIDSVERKGAVSFSELKQYIEENGTEVICDGVREGYYDAEDIREKYADESYWFDPLGNRREAKGEVGFQKVEIQHLFSGDLMVEVTSKVFYGTRASDYGNSVGASLYYKGEYIWGNYQDIQSFLSYASSGMYALSNDKHDTILSVVSLNTIKIMHHNYKIVTINRSDEPTEEERKAEEDRLAAINEAQEQYVLGKKQLSYQRALEFYNQEKYREAYTAFTALDDYLDSDEYVKRCIAILIENSRTNARLISTGGAHSVAVTSDGHVLATGSNYRNQCDVQGWQDIVAVSARNADTLGLRSDGTVVAAGWEGSYKVQKWSDIVAISAGSAHAVGLCQDGTVVAVGYNKYGQCDVSGWEDIKDISAGYFHTVGLRTDGTVVAVGQNTYGECDVSTWNDIVAISAGSDFTIGIKADGSVIATGNNYSHQCDVSAWKDVVAVSAGSYHTIGLLADGTVVATGSNYHGECDFLDIENVIAVSTCDDHSLALLEDGQVVACGENDSGECDTSGWRLFAAPDAG